MPYRKNTNQLEAIIVFEWYEFYGDHDLGDTHEGYQRRAAAELVKTLASHNFKARGINEGFIQELPVIIKLSQKRPYDYKGD